MRRMPALIAAVLAVTGLVNAAAASETAAAPAKPNIVFVLVDDLAWNLVQYMPQVQQLQRDGTTFTNYTVTDSLCCPSRSSIFTGKFPHDTGVFTNEAPDGGFGVFHNRGNEDHTFATALQGQGYATAMMGKYLNGYLPKDLYVPPGWSEWDVAGNAYGEYNYNLNENGKLVPYGNADADYLTDVVSGKGQAFIKRSAAAGKPFLLEIATFAPHGPFTPARQDLDKFPGLTAPRGPAFNTLPTNAPGWLAGNGPLTADELKKIDTDFRKRAQAVQAVDRMIANLRQTLTAAGVAGNTYVVFSSDNGFHMGQHRLVEGKQTAFDHDIRVPLVVAGPSVAAGLERPQVVQNIDLAPTFERLGGAPIATDVDGRQLVTLLTGGTTAEWRTASLIEHHGPGTSADDPDVQDARNGMPTTYSAVRTADFTYVEYDNGEREYYDRGSDPNELHNTAGSLPAARLSELHSSLTALVGCHTGAACWTAGHVS
ncbi:sulfatase family protein [Dactylosporangium sp. CS-047395]|uniref:sulfatase family protein n=1 Tax=Dactylosporangium sp. CS-047395 TaxID=3239936 RepID=UPI003D932F38